MTSPRLSGAIGRSMWLCVCHCCAVFCSRDATTFRVREVVQPVDAPDLLVDHTVFLTIRPTLYIGTHGQGPRADEAHRGGGGTSPCSVATRLARCAARPRIGSTLPAPMSSRSDMAIVCARRRHAIVFSPRSLRLVSRRFAWSARPCEFGSPGGVTDRNTSALGGGGGCGQGWVVGCRICAAHAPGGSMRLEGTARVSWGRLAEPGPVRFSAGIGRQRPSLHRGIHPPSRLCVRGPSPTWSPRATHTWGGCRDGFERYPVSPMLCRGR